MIPILTIYGVGTCFAKYKDGSLAVAIGKKQLVIPDNANPDTLKFIKYVQDQNDKIFNLEIRPGEVL